MAFHFGHLFFWKSQIPASEIIGEYGVNVKGKKGWGMLS
jgi:hypothetical protein